MNARSLSHLAGIATLAALLPLSHPAVKGVPRGGGIVTAASYTARPPENAVCKPLAATIEHWLPILVRSRSNGNVRPYPWVDAAIAVDDFIGPATPRLNRWVGEVGTGFEGTGWRPSRNVSSYRQGLRHISALCPSLPASVARGPMPTGYGVTGR